MPSRPSRTATLASVLAAFLMLGVQAAHAGATLVSSTPTRYAALIHPPRLIRLRFSEAIVKKSSIVRVTDLSGRPQRISPVKIRDDRTLEVKIGSRLQAGVYRVHWTLVSAVDGSNSAGSYQFTVQ